ncbi:MAG: metallophosphoesterase family protein [bacterium]|nr:metallophosphoesterase family protein [bacterium]
MYIRWRTDVASESQLSYGPSVANLSTTIVESGPTTEHEIQITGLQPFTRYYYSVGTSTQTLAGPDSSFTFVTSPTVGTRQDVRIWAIGDSGGNTSKSAAVANEYLNFAGSHPADVWLMLGDNAYMQGLDSEMTWAIFDNYPGILRNTVLWPTPGNHDLTDIPESSDPATGIGPYFDAFTLPTQAEVGGFASGIETYYSFDYANIHFVSVNIYWIPFTPGSAVNNWLAADLASTDQEWVIVYLHFPSYTRGERDSDTDYWMKGVREWINPILEQGGTDLVLTGHSHSYERSMMIDGHYGVAATLTPAHILGSGDGDFEGDGSYQKPAGRVPHSGTVYVVNGVGENAHPSGTFDHPIMVTSHTTEGSLIVDVSGDLLNATFVSRYGDILDRFQISKTTGVPSMGNLALIALASVLALVAGVTRRDSN